MSKFFSTKKIKTFSLLSLMIFSNLYAENFRVRKVLPVSISKNLESTKVTAGINDAIFIKLPEDTTFINAVELNIKIPEIIATWRDSVAYIFYDNVSPVPSENKADYYGEKLFLKTLPSKLSLALDIPVSSDFSLKENPYAVKVTPAPDYRKGIFMRFQMVMKGVPEELESAQIEITARPVLKNVGILKLSLSPSSTAEKKYSVFVDDLPVQNWNRLMLETGEHHLSVVSDAYRNELRTFRIEQARTTPLEITLHGSEPAFKIICPASASVLLDGKQVKNTKEPFTILPGDHIVKFTLGDYEAVQNVTAVTGRTYIISLDVSASVTEEE